MFTINKKRLSEILPGLVLAVFVAVLSKGAAVFVPRLGGSTIAILLGILFGNTVFKQGYLAKGTKFAESKLLEYAVVLLGFTVTFQTISQMGIKGLLYVLSMMTVVIISTYLIGRKLGFSEEMTLLMAGGNAVCGSSAIGAIAPAIQAGDEEKGQVITLVNLMGTAMMLTLPFIGAALFGIDGLGTSALIGGTLQSVGQVVAGASLIGPETVTYAMLFKITRIIMLVAVVVLFEKKVSHHRQIDLSESKTKKLPIPWYIIGFLILCLINSTLNLPSAVIETTDYISSWFEMTALAAIGLRLDLSKFLKEGPRFLIYGLSVGTLQTVAAVLFIVLLQLN